MISPQVMAASPAWLPLERAATGELRLVRLEESDYRAASFLDARVLRSGVPQERCPAAAAAAAGALLSPGAHYLFHIGHVGSTLISRLIGESASFFVVREPAMLRALAADPVRGFEGLDLRCVLALLARTWRTEQRALVKATSFVGELAGVILEIDTSASAILVFTPALPYLRCILGGPSSRVESRLLAPSRRARLRARLGDSAPAQPQSEGEWIALSWLAEMAALVSAASRFGARVLWVDFEAFLEAPAAALARVLRALGSTPDPGEVERIVAGPTMRRYSKAPEHAYDTALRRQVLEAADREHRAEIDRGMRWLAGTAGRHPLIDAALGARAQP